MNSASNNPVDNNWQNNAYYQLINIQNNSSTLTNPNERVDQVGQNILSNRDRSPSLRENPLNSIFMNNHPISQQNAQPPQLNILQLSPEQLRELLAVSDDQVLPKK